MLRVYLTNKYVLGAIGFLIVLSVACVLWYRYDTVHVKQELAKDEELLRQRDVSQNAETDNQTKKDTKSHSPGEIGEKFADGKNRVVFNLTEPPIPKSKIKQIGVVENIKNEKTTQIDSKVSLYGFGPYPEIPVDFPFPVDWNFPGSDADHELMARVAIKLWTQGIETYGITMEDGLAYPNYLDTVYIRWAETTDDDGSPIQYIKELGGYPPACLRIVENNIVRLGERGAMTAVDIPSDITVKLYDEAGIDPYTFLELPK